MKTKIRSAAPLALAIALLCTGLAVEADAAGPQLESQTVVKYAMIIANNGTFDGSRTPLRFADDDGARYAEMFKIDSEVVELYSVLDADTQRLFPQLASIANAPSRANVLGGLERLFTRMRQQLEQGRRVAFYFIYSGHGEIGSDGEGFVNLLDGPFSRSDIFRHVVAASPATTNHLIIDACNAFYMVGSRGEQASAAGDFSDLIRGFVARDNLAAHPNTGVLLSTASASEVHEWGRIQAGIFSHQVRSALAGAADSDEDGAVTYSEVAAFLAAANGSIPDPKARIQAHTQAPALNLREPLSRTSTAATRILLPENVSGHFYIEDDRGVRYAELNKEKAFGVTLALVPRPRYFLRDDSQEFLLEPANTGRTVRLEDTVASKLSMQPRGAAHDQFDQFLFGLAFGPKFRSGFDQALVAYEAAPHHPAPTVLHSASLEAVQYGALTASVGMALAAVTFDVMSRQSAQRYRDGAGSRTEVDGFKSRAETLQTTSRVMISLSTTSALVALATWLYDLEP